MNRTDGTVFDRSTRRDPTRRGNVVWEKLARRNIAREKVARTKLSGKEAGANGTCQDKKTAELTRMAMITTTYSPIKARSSMMFPIRIGRSSLRNNRSGGSVTV